MTTTSTPQKPWYQSATIISSIATAIIALCGIFKIDLSSIDVNQNVLAIATVIGTCMTIYGRIRATHQITSGTNTTANILMLCLILPVLITGCASTTPSPTPTPTPTPVSTPIVAPADNARFVASVQAAQLILETGGRVALATLSPTDQHTYAMYLSGSGHVFESLETGVAPTSTQVTNALSAYFPTTASNYTAIVQLSTAAVSTIGVALKAYVPAGSENYAAYVNYSLQALAQTAYAVADPYLTQAAS